MHWLESWLKGEKQKSRHEEEMRMCVCTLQQREGEIHEAGAKLVEQRLAV